MNEKEFQSTVLDSIDEIKEGHATQQTKQQELITNLGQLDKETKKAFEDLTQLKNAANDQAATLKALEKVIVQLKREERMAFGNPVERIVRDEEKRTLFNAIIRHAMNIKLSGPHRKALGEDSSPGSTIIDDRLAKEIYDTLSSFGIWNTFAVRQLSTKQTKYPVKTVRPVANFILTEAGTISDDTNKAGTSVTLEVEVIAALLNVSLQLLEDAEMDVTADVLNDFAEAYAFRLDHAALNATGAADATHGGMTGIFQGGTAAAAAAGNATVETTDFEDWTRCLLTVDPVVLVRAAKWWMHPQILVRALSVKDSNGRPIFLTAIEAPSAGNIGSILGYGVVPCFAAPTTNAAAAKVAVFGDPNANVVGIRRDFVFEGSDHHKWNSLERSFRGWGRAGTKIRRALGFGVLTLTA